MKGKNIYENKKEFSGNLHLFKRIHRRCGVCACRRTFFLKCKDENIKKPLKIALMLFVVFLGAEAAALIFEDLFSAIDLWNASYWVDLIVDLSKTIVFGLTAFSAFSGGSKEFYELEGFSGEK